MSSTHAEHRMELRWQREHAETKDHRLHLLDLDNQLGGVAFGPDEYRKWWHIYRHHAVGARPGDQIVIAASGITAKTAALALIGEPVQWRIRNGRDGADTALLEFADLDHAARRFGTLVIASGDHIFAGLATEAAAAGLRTHQVIGRGGCSRELWQACGTHTRLRLGPVAPSRLAFAA